MSLITSTAFTGSGPVCSVCGKPDCHDDAMGNPIAFEVLELEDHSTTERMYDEKTTLAEAVSRDLPGAREMALGRKPTQSPENRAHQPEHDRAG
jgi:hypothetical protein